jgi:hypothetical protein
VIERVAQDEAGGTLRILIVSTSSAQAAEDPYRLREY